jgi:hypothetical protein
VQHVRDIDRDDALCSADDAREQHDLARRQVPAALFFQLGLRNGRIATGSRHG